MENSEKQDVGGGLQVGMKRGKWEIVVLVMALVITMIAGVTFGVLWCQEKNRNSGVEVAESVTTAEGVEVTESVTTAEVVDGATTTADLKLVGEKYKTERPERWIRQVADQGKGMSVIFEQVFESNDAGLEVGDTLYASVDWDKLGYFYGSNLSYDPETAAYNSERISVDGIDADKVVDIVMTSFGQMVGRETVFFLMEDGTVEYIPLVKVLEAHRVESQGKVEGLEDVIIMRNVSGAYAGDAIAQTAKGDFWSLGELLIKQGVWE